MDGCWEKERDGKGKEGMLGRDGKGWGKKGGWWWVVGKCMCMCMLDG